jgi:hypothetical protein
VIVWNATKHYDQRTCTCQHFVASALRTLGLSKPVQGEIGTNGAIDHTLSVRLLTMFFGM